MGLSLLGSGLIGGVSGAASGAAAAEAANVTEANKQAEAMNLQSQAAAVNDMYQQQVENRHINNAAKMRQAIAEQTTPLIEKNLNDRGFTTDTSKVGTKNSAGHELELALNQTISDARAQIMAAQGFVDPTKLYEENTKANDTTAVNAVRLENAKVLALAQENGRTNQGLGAALAKIEAAKDVVKSMKPNELRLIANDFSSTPELKAAANAQLLLQIKNQPTGLLANPADQNDAAQQNQFQGFTATPVK